jgi:hypothetical protein
MVDVFNFVDRALAPKPDLIVHGSDLPATAEALRIEANLVAPPDWFQRIASPVEGEPNFDQPCAERRGRIEELTGRVFLHFCIECGRWGTFGYGVNLRAGRLGEWYCATHRPQRVGRPPDAAITTGPS